VYYVYVIGGIIDIDTSLGIEGHGKTSDTKMMIWKPAFEAINQHFVLGDYYCISSGTGVSQLHNTHLDVFASYGFIPFILFISILFFQVSRVYEQATSLTNRIGVYAFMACFISGVFEASLVSGSAGLYVLSFGFLLLANSQIDCNNA
jgi:O-antigen ligase